MSFRINTNIAALNAHANGVANNRALNTSLERLSSGLRINKAADDASGMAIADSLRAQASALGQAIKNANDGIAIIQTADKAMDEQIKILDTIKTKATQAAQDGQTEETRKALQQDIVRLMEELDNIAGTTSFNGQQLLSGQYTNKEFQIGAYSNTTVKASIGATSSDKIGNTRFETGSLISADAEVTLTFKAVDGSHDIKMESVVISNSAGTGIGVLAETINKNSDKTGVRASWSVQSTGVSAVASGTLSDLTINGVSIGTIKLDANDKNGALVNAINLVKDKTGVEASIDERGHLNLTSVDGRGIVVSASSGLSAVGFGTDQTEVNYGRLTLVRLDARDIVVSGGTNIGFDGSNESEETINLRSIKGGFTSSQAEAMGFVANDNIAYQVSGGVNAGVTTLKGAMAVIDIAESAQKLLDKIRSDLGSVQNQLVSTVNNISVTQVNVKSAESQIRDVDFAEESANFNKHNLLAQSGSYAMSQANAVQQNVMKLLQ
ncbi:flagellin A [Hydrogenimonas thermophila]|uniref:flagellin A n=1 Tax=Hydrogenimonas thermophila TaxID=223786 RepID=UPI0029370AEB|nr:flagellin A [Hydrogenimonas thermophila]WOE69467.1 flagellin A [Hydrogenimonas thermophila]WOE71978.1 flagellin A [Hydrogenimonas thermophila]